MRSRVVGATVAFVAAALTGVSGQAPPRGIPAADAPPLAVVQAGDAARYLFDAARDARWGDAASQLEALHTAVAALPRAAAAPELRHSLRTRARELAHTVPRRQRIRTMEAANAVTKFASELAETFHTNLPAQIPLLDYYGRQLQIGVAAHRPSLIRQATASMREAWDAVRPELERRGLVDDARRLTDIVVTLEGTNRRADIARLAQAEIDKVEQLETTLR